MSNLQDNDLFVYQEAATGNIGAVANNNRSSLAPDDLFVVYRDGINYKVKSSDVGGGGGGALETVTLAPLSLTIDPDGVNDITAVTNLSSILPGSQATFQWYQYDDPTGGTGTLLKTTVSDTAIQDTYTVGGASQGKYIGCTVSYLGTTETETTRSEIGTAQVPVAVMNGLRFDSGRKTYLNRTPGVEGNRRTWTWSGWVKRSGLGTNEVLFAEGTGDAALNRLTFKDNAISFLFFSGSNKGELVSSSKFTDTSAWYHIVFACDTTQDIEKNRWKIWVDGTQITSFSTETYPAKNSEMYVNGNGLQSLGSQAAQSLVFFLDGYLSDVYFVDGYALPPETFGKKFLLGWGPLGNDVVEENLYNLQPADPTPENNYDDRANTDEVWSGAVTGNSFEAGRDSTKMFDGDTSTFTGNGSNGWYWDPSGYSLIGTLEVMLENSANSVTVTRNGSDTEYIGTGGQYIDCGTMEGVTRVTFTSTINSSCYCKAIKVGGRLLVDQGVWDNSQNWSDGFSASNPPAGQSSSDAFNGSLANGAGPRLAKNGQDKPASLTGLNFSNATVKVYVFRENTGTIQMAVTAGDQTISNQTVGTSVTAFTLNNCTGTSIDFLFTEGNVANTSVFIAAFEIDDAILVDSGEQWDTSQRWSDGTITGVGAASSGPWTELFDGKLTTRPGPNSGDFYKIEFTPAIDTTDVDCQIYGSKGSGAGVLKVNNSDFTFTNTTDDWITVPTGNELTSLEFPAAGSANPAIIFGVRVDGALLVDAAPTWNTSQVWSNYGQPFDYNGGWRPIFDGDLNVRGRNDPGNERVLIFDPPLPFTTLRIYAVGRANAITDQVIFNENRVVVTDTTNDGNYLNIDWVDCVPLMGGDTQLESITLANLVESNYEIGFNAIEVDGEILVDAGFGTNGFYLPFDPAETGKVYSNGTTSGTTQSSWTTAFDGSDSTGQKTDENGEASLTFGSSIPFTNKLRIRGKVSTADTSLKVYVNNTPVPFANNNDLQWADVTSLITSPITSVAVEGNGGANTSTLTAIEVDGKILVDHSSIGVDMSGNDNHFHDQNFILDTDTSQVWSSYGTFTNISGTPNNIFNGDLSTGTSNTASAIASWELASSIPGGVIEVCVNNSSTSNKININDVGDKSLRAVNGINWHTVGTFATFEKISWSQSGGGFALRGIKIDGKVLIDTGLATPLDTVPDTPMKNYATLESGSNGNLVGSGALTYTGESGKSYYYETNGGAVTSPAPVGNAASGTHNFGQQPFVSPRITSQDLTAGTVTLGDEQFDGSQEWSTSGDIAAWSNVFDGDSSNGISNIVGDKQAATWNIGSGNAIPGPVQIYLNNGTGTGWLTINGNAIDLDAGGPNQNQWLSVPGVSELYSIALSQGNEWGSITAIKVNGKLLVDSSVYNTWDTSQNWSDSLTSSSGWNALSSAPNGFNGILDGSAEGTAQGGHGTSPTSLTFAPSGGITFNDKVEIWANNGDQDVSYNTGGLQSLTAKTWVEVATGGGELTSLKIERQSPNGASFAGIRVDGKILIDSGAGTFDTLYQTWSQWVSATLRTLLARSESRVDALEQVILAQAVDWSYGSTYQTDALVKFNCSVWRATSDGITTRTPIPTNSDVWENLYIDCERTHTMDDLIPDNWSQEQRRAALQELLLELSEDDSAHSNY